MKSIQTIFHAALLLVLGVQVGYAKKRQAKPNLLIIHTDEHSFRTLGCYRDDMTPDQAFVWGPDAKVETPNIDRIAEEGILCANYYASSPVCTPSRASFISGMYPQNTGAPKNGLHLSEDVTTFADALKTHGYATSYVGKWHLAGHEKYTFEIKNKAGFDDNRFMMRGGHAPYYLFNAKGMKGIGEKEYDKLPAEKKKNAIHATDYFTNKALEILDRDKDKPFCMMLSIPDPHTPDVAKAPYNTMFDDMKVETPRTLTPELMAIKPIWGKSKDPKDKNEAHKINVKALRQYFGMVKHIDDAVGRIMSFLKENNLEDNTIIIFTADHGDMFYEHGRRNKGVPYEASARIPFVLRYPNKINGNRVIRKAYTTTDFTPTILGMMGFDAPVEYEGRNCSADFLSNKKEIVSDEITYFAKTGGWWVAAVDNRYKLVLGKGEKPYLFDLKVDPDEIKNFYNDPAYKDIAERLNTKLFSMMKEYKEPGLKLYQ